MGVQKQEALFFPHRPSASPCAVRYPQNRQPGLFLIPWEALGLFTSWLFTENICRNKSFLRFSCKLEQATCGSGKRDRALWGENISIQPCKLAPRSIILSQECQRKALSYMIMQSLGRSSALTVCFECTKTQWEIVRQWKWILFNLTFQGSWFRPPAFSHTYLQTRVHVCPGGLNKITCVDKVCQLLCPCNTFLDALHWWGKGFSEQ